MSTIEKVGPYVDRFLNDEELQGRVRSAVKNGGAALARARGRGSAKKAAQAAKVRRRAVAATVTARRVGGALREREKKRKPRLRWVRRLLLLGILGGAA